jgi:hypothetical protein
VLTAFCTWTEKCRFADPERIAPITLSSSPERRASGERTEEPVMPVI